MKNIIKLSVLAALLLMVSGCAIHTGVMSNSAQLSHANFSYVERDLNGTCQTTRILGLGGVFKADLVEIAKKNMLANYELQDNQALANVTVDWKHSRYVIVKTTKCTVSADIVEFRNEGLVSY